MIFCIASYFIILFSALLRGGKATSSLIGIEPCSFISWLIFLITIIILYIGSIKIWVG